MQPLPPQVGSSSWTVKDLAQGHRAGISKNLVFLVCLNEAPPASIGGQVGIEVGQGLLQLQKSHLAPLLGYTESQKGRECGEQQPLVQPSFLPS